MSVQIREASAEDAPEIHRWILSLARYEKLESSCISTPEDIARALNGSVRVLFADLVCAGNPGSVPQTAGFALWYYGFSSFSGKRILYIEDIFVEDSFRGKGVGSAIFGYLSALCRSEDCCRLQWSVLDWNRDAINFYNALGAKKINGWSWMTLDPALPGERCTRVGGIDQTLE